MTIKVAAELVDIVEFPGLISLQVRRADDSEAAAAGLRAALDEIAALGSTGPEMEGALAATPNWMGGVAVVPDGPFMTYVDAKPVPPHEVARIPDIVARHLRQAGVRHALVALPPKTGPLDGIASTPRAVVLLAYPPPRRDSLLPPLPPPAWREAAGRWLVEHCPDELVHVRASLVQFPLRVADVASFVEVFPAQGPSLVVAGDLATRAWGVGLESSLRLVFGGPEATDDELVEVGRSFQELARSFGPEAAQVYVHIGYFISFARTPHRAGPPGGPRPELLASITDEVCLDAFPYQVLGPAHLARLAAAQPDGRLPESFRPLPNHRAELAIGELAEWLVDRPTRKERLEEGRRLLAPCLVNAEEVRRLKQRPSAAVRQEMERLADQAPPGPEAPHWLLSSRSGPGPAAYGERSGVVVTIKVAAGVVDHIVEFPDSISLQVRQADDPEAAAAGLRAALDEIATLGSTGPEMEGAVPATPNSVGGVAVVPDGPFITYVDAKSVLPHEVARIPKIVARHLRRAGVRRALIALPRKTGPLDGIASTPRAVVLLAYPPPRRDSLDAPLPPPAWLEVAARWLADHAPGELVHVRASLVQFPLRVADVASFVEAFPAQGPSLVVAGDLATRAWGVGLESSLRLVFGGPEASDDELVEVGRSFQELARSFGPEAAQAYVVLEYFGAFAHRHNAGPPGGPSPSLLDSLRDELCLDAFPYQVLGPAHLARIAAAQPDGHLPGSFRPLPNQRAELAVGELADWLLGHAHPRGAPGGGPPPAGTVPGQSRGGEAAQAAPPGRRPPGDGAHRRPGAAGPGGAPWLLSRPVRPWAGGDASWLSAVTEFPVR